MANIGTEISIAADLLNQGQCVAIPTETVYGLAANALNPDAVYQIFAIKNRPDFDPLIVHGKSAESVFSWAREVPPAARQLAHAFWPGPLTLVLPKSNDIPSAVTSGLETVGLRVPNHPLLQQLLAQLPFPLAAPSANPFGYISPTTAAHVQAQLGDKIPYILDGGPCDIGLESTIVGFDAQQRALIFRAGMISALDLAAVLGYIPETQLSSSKPQAPGMLLSHYAPKTPFMPFFAGAPKDGFGFLGMSPSAYGAEYSTHIFLSEDMNPYACARQLYHAMRQLDEAGLNGIYFEWPPNGPLWVALQDRLQRAAHIDMA
jgi:L-threonylcarbamoyladenylate synthase